MREENRNSLSNQLGGERRTWRCPDETHIAAYVDHRLSGRDKERLETHLADCSYCLGQVASLTRLRDVPLAADMPPGVVTRAKELAGRNSAQPPFKALWRWSGVAATMAIALFVTVGTRPVHWATIAKVPIHSTDIYRQGQNQAVTPDVLFPREGQTVSRANLEFRWTPLAAGGDVLYYEVVVVSADGHEVWAGRANLTAIRVPDNVSLGAGQTYYVRVTAHLRDVQSVKSQAVGFQVNGQ